MPQHHALSCSRQLYRHMCLRLTQQNSCNMLWIGTALHNPCSRLGLYNHTLRSKTKESRGTLAATAMALQLSNQAGWLSLLISESVAHGRA